MVEGLEVLVDGGESFENENEVTEEDILKGRKVIYTPSVVFEDGMVCEQGFDGKQVYFIVYNPRTGEVSKEDLIVDLDKVYKPVANRDVETGQVLFPSEALDFGSEEDLVGEVEEFLNYWHEQPNPIERKLDIAYVFLTYISDLIPQIPYRRVLGRFGTGKSTWLEVVGSICYRAVNLAGCDSEASLRRTFDLWKGTSLIDEADFSRSDLYSAVIKILNVGWDRKKGYYRCCDDRDPRKVLSFYVYGPKLLATREPFKDPALESRCLTFIAQENQTPKPLFRMRKFDEWALKLRNKLLMWRFKRHWEFQSKIEKLEDLEVFRELYGENSTISSRIKQVLTPLSLVSSTLNWRGIAETLNEELKQVDPEAQFEEDLKNVLKDMVQEGKITKKTVKLPVSDVTCATCVTSYETPYYEVRVKDLAIHLAENPDDYKEIRSLTTKIGTLLRKNGIKVKRDREGNYALIPSTWVNPQTSLPVKSTEIDVNVQKCQKETLEPPPIRGCTGYTGYTNQTKSKPTIAEVLEKLRMELKGPFMDGDFIETVEKYGFSRGEAEKLFELLVDQGKIARNFEGFWRWI